MDKVQVKSQAAVADNEEDYGLIRPNLIRQLRSILDQYPDDGQILKELIQNAEDAGASEVRLLYDEHSHGTQTLHHPELAKFQGPALYSYNNALFTEKDWTGIRMLQDSVKEKDPMKVGRFGLGFKSVLHMTDLPSVLSGDRIFVIDPHEKYFQFRGDKTSGYSWHLGQKKSEIRRLPDQFSTFKGIFNSTDETLYNGYYKGTLFRFPLRQSPSELSSTVYKGSRMEDLFSSFEADAHLILIFLKNLERVETSVRRLGSKEQLKRFEVRIADQYLDYVRSKRKEFTEKVEQSCVSGTSVTVTYPIHIETVRYNGNKADIKIYKYLVNAYFAGQQMTIELSTLAKDPILSLVPMVGTAMEMEGVTKNNATKESTESLNAISPEEEVPKGQVFCFLPLPVEQKSSSGLPIHVNGYFAVSQNRRHLKWPSAGQNTKSDKSVLWNQCLLKEVVPKSYLELLRQAIHLSTRNPQLLGPADIYGAIPNLVLVDEKWQGVLAPLFTPLFCLPMFYTPLDHGKWIPIEMCIFDCLKEDESTKKVITQCLLSSRVNVVSTPVHLLHALGAFSQYSPEIISPSIVRTSLSSHPLVYSSLPHCDKLNLLRYILKDEDFREMQGIKLLPSANKSYQTFHPTAAGVYIPTQDCPRCLLSNLGECLVADDLDDLLMLKLCRLADEGCMQVRHLTPPIVAQLLQRMIPQAWRGLEIVEWDLSQSDDSLPPVDWLEHLWDFLRKEYPCDLSLFHGLPILPLNSETTLKLIPLTGTTPAVLKSAMGTDLEKGSQEMLQLIGVYIVEDLPQYARNHAAVLGSYVKLPLSEDVLDVMHCVYLRKGKSVIDRIRAQASSEQRSSILSVLSKLNQRQLTQQYIKFLRQLPLFKSSGSEENHHVSVNEVNESAPVEELPFAPDKKFLDTTNPDPKRVAQMLGVTFLNVTTLLKTNILNEIRQSRLGKDKVEIVASHIFNNFQQYSKEDPEFSSHLSNVTFISTEKGRLEKPKELCDPESEIMMRVFQNEDVFPAEHHREPDRLLILRKLGLKSEKTLTPKDLLQSIVHIEDMVMAQEDYEQIERKSIAILKFLSYKPDMLFEEVNGQLLMEWANNVTWIPTMRERCPAYPESLPWVSTDAFKKASEVKSQDLIPLLGSVYPVIKADTGQKISEIFGWDSPPDVKTVLKQLLCIVQSYTSEEKPKFLALVFAVYDHLFKLDLGEVVKVTQHEKLNEFLWHGDGFTSVTKMVLKRPLVHLHPYLYTLPTEMRPFAKLYHALGIPVECTPKMMINVIHEISEKYLRKEKANQAGEQRKPKPELTDDNVESKQDMQLVIDILNHLVDFIDSMPADCRQHILVPTQESPDIELRLLPVIECTYCDVEWVRQGFDLMSFDEQDGITFIHPNLPTATAEALEVPTLMSRMLNAEELAITGFGQSEPLTNRLHRLLEDYTDGLAIPKEIIQNADDACATEVRFLYDERTNLDCMKYLIDVGMKECQGPALWAYNNSVFTDEDFENITKLGGATKEQDTEKIGKFGLGFNAVYNVTDVPSFISRNNIVFFDPHTTHLGKGIKDRSKPGIKIDMRRNRTLLRKLPDQFKPYDGVFGCCINSENEGYFDGTLFRLPLRTQNQAKKSEISSIHYNRPEVMELVQMLARSAHQLLLFTQSVQKITVNYLPPGGDPANSVEILLVEKKAERVLRELNCKIPMKKSMEKSEVKLVQNAGILKAATAYMRKRTPTKKARNTEILESPKSSMILGTRVITPETASVLGLPPSGGEKYWLVSACLGEDVSMSIASTSREGLVPAAAVAVALTKSDDGFIPVPLSDSGWSGHAYCYLPLPVTTGLPVHVNAPFAIQSNRRQLSELTEDDKQNSRVEWNNALMDDAVTKAYILMLQDMRGLLPPGVEVKFYNVWPEYDSTVEYFHTLVESFYRGVASLLAIPLYHDGQNSVSLANAVFLDPAMTQSIKIGPKAMKAFTSVNPEQAVVAVPAAILKSFKAAGLEEVIRHKTYNIERFYKEIFFPNVKCFEDEVRDSLLLYALSKNNQELDNMLMNSNCIPTTPDGKVLSKPEDLIHPTALTSKLYSPEDGRFPYGNGFNNGNVLGALHKLGLKVNEVSWFDLVERTNTVEILYQLDTAVGKKRLLNILLFMDRKLLQSTKYMQSYQELKNERADDGYDNAKKAVLEVPFLAVMPKPGEFPLKWRGDDFQSSELMCPSELYTKDMRYLVSATQPIVDEENMTGRVKDFLGLSKHQASIEQVMTQLEHALNVDPASLPEESKQFDELQRILYAVYNFIQDRCAIDRELAETVSAVWSTRPCILVGNEYLTSNKVALNFPYECGPYLYALPHDLARRYKALMKLLGVKEQFDVPDYMNSIQQLQKENDNQPLQGRNLDLGVRLVSQLNNRMKINKLTAAEVEEQHGTIYVPNTKGVLKPSSSLCYNDCPWIGETQTMNFTHPDLTFQTSACLGVKTKRQEALSKHAIGISFGQKERLTNSLKRILNSYPCDHEILKELIQNADDAKATQIHFIRDPRHHSETHVFENSWKPLQGPALCVYNNRPFTLSDLEGIQRLGEGSKTQDPSKTGQYGVGFSSVYHLTDVPSVLTSGKAVGGKTLCVFDPHCRYVPGATPSEPGMRYQDIDDLKAAFPDVFGCYLEEHLQVKDSTIFRFPLRNQAMADCSHISKTPITLSKVQALLDNLKDELFEILLFTNYVEEISISDIDPGTGKLSKTYTIKAMVSAEHRKIRTEMAEIIKGVAQDLKNGDVTINQVPEKEISYTVFITDTNGNQEKWAVSQRLGFVEERAELPEQVVNAFKDGDLALLPRGGAACLLERRVHGRLDSPARPSRVFCFLPLPMQTNLPVHINGHFALGYENRRHLWSDLNSSGYKREWNDFLCQHVISQAYIALLRSIRMQGMDTEMENDVAKTSCSRQILDSALKAYEAYFPDFGETNFEWDLLVKAVYKVMAVQEEPVLPAVREWPADQKSSQHSNAIPQWQVLWLPPKGDGSNKAFFSKIEKEDTDETHSSFLGKFKSWFKTAPQLSEKSDSQILKEVLLDCGFKLLEATPVIVENFRRSGVDVDFMQPEGVVLFLRSYSTEKPMCDLGKLPSSLECTVFKDEKTLGIVLNYCKLDPDFLLKLDGLPLLLTQDGMVRVFDSENPVFYTEHHDLVPACSHSFLARPMMQSIFKEVEPTSSVVFQPFTIESLAAIIDQKLPSSQYYQTGERVEWVKSFSTNPNEIWMKRLWTFLKGQLNNDLTNDELEGASKTAVIGERLKPLQDWCLIPCRTPTKRYLVPIGEGSNVIDFRNGVSNYKYFSIRDVLRKLNLAEVDTVVINTDISTNTEAARALVTTLDKPAAVLKMLHETITAEGYSVNLNKDDCSKLLKYFAENVDGLLQFEDNIGRLRDLPFYATIYGDIIKLTDCLVYILPAKIPTNGIDVWQSRAGTVFLERNEYLQSLYDYMGCASISIIDVYCKFIFQHFEYFPPEDRMVHLHHVYSQYLKDGATDGNISMEERESLVEALKELPFIEDENGELQPASSFYDPENVVFRIMLPEDKFPPRANKFFRESEWYTFLGKLGLIREVGKDMYLQYTKQVAMEGVDSRSASALTKSKVLVQHLYGLTSQSRDAILADIATVPFISPEPASRELTELYPQHGDIGNGKLACVSFRESISKEHEKLVWTRANLLPKWADPMQQDRLPLDEKVSIMENLEIQKSPSLHLASAHFLTLCEHLTSGPHVQGVHNTGTRLDVFKANYRFLQEHGLENEEVKEKLQKANCIIVDGGKKLVQAKQTALNMYDSEEIRPYLYKVPMELGEFQRLFQTLGSTDRASVDQYAGVLDSIRKLVGREALTPNELKLAYKAVRGLLDTLENTASSRNVSVGSLYLPSEDGRLMEATRLVFNDSPSFYDRVKDFGLHFVVDLKECGFQSRTAEEVLRILPQRLRPGMLSAYVREVLIDRAKSVTTEGLAAHLNNRLKSESFLIAVARLMRHEAHRSGRSAEEPKMYSVLDRLSTINVFGVKEVITQLTFKDKSVAGSEMEKVCFVEKVPGAHADIFLWRVYIKNDSSLSQDLLIPLAEVINTILSGLLRDSVLYLLPILACKETEIQSKLDTLNVRLDHSQIATRRPTLPPPGTTVPEDQVRLLRWGEVDFNSGEYFGYKVKESDEMMYAVVGEEVMSPEGDRVYLADVGGGHDSVIVNVKHMYKFVR